MLRALPLIVLATASTGLEDVACKANLGTYAPSAAYLLQSATQPSRLSPGAVEANASIRPDLDLTDPGKGQMPEMPELKSDSEIDGVAKHLLADKAPAIFAHVDKDKSGTIDVAELTAILTELDTLRVQLAQARAGQLSALQSDAAPAPPTAAGAAGSSTPSPKVYEECFRFMNPLAGIGVALHPIADVLTLRWDIR
eukprot:TRINITY_DN27968_c0_g1_i1.p1 TRINITY_DN27968_c0_g1~~TRINITY_DN27968_c0_g1_i1.p1  ORF type:complete len:197 (+),score=35.66 TRINITY_DN27968_c0_g1_i1:51-641(+)